MDDSKQSVEDDNKGEGCCEPCLLLGNTDIEQLSLPLEEKPGLSAAAETLTRPLRHAREGATNGGGAPEAHSSDPLALGLACVTEPPREEVPSFTNTFDKGDDLTPPALPEAASWDIELTGAVLSSSCLAEPANPGSEKQQSEKYLEVESPKLGGVVRYSDGAGETETDSRVALGSLLRAAGGTEEGVEEKEAVFGCGAKGEANSSEEMGGGENEKDGRDEPIKGVEQETLKVLDGDEKGDGLGGETSKQIEPGRVLGDVTVGVSPPVPLPLVTSQSTDSNLLLEAAGLRLEDLTSPMLGSSISESSGAGTVSTEGIGVPHQAQPPGLKQGGDNQGVLAACPATQGLEGLLLGDGDG
ncbi:unnamed protein product, partial [Choristocarpus tenellus]